MPRIGDQIGPYTLIRKVGRGGFGEVWLADKKTRIATTEFALKLAIEENPDIVAIQQEAELWKQASGHPNVLPIIEADIYDEYIVIVSEFARGGSLKDWLKTHQGAAPSIDAAVEMISGILSGLEHLHGLRIIHRDLKPDNILLQGNRPRLADFGLARILRSSLFSQTVAGTPEYMAPEAFLNERSEQADLWAVGVMLYQMLTGDLPFPLNERMSPWQKMAVITGQEVTPPPHTVPVPLREVIIRSLQKNPEHRYKSAGEMFAAIVEAHNSLKYKGKQQTIVYPIRTNDSSEEIKPLVSDPSPSEPGELIIEPAVDSKSIPDPAHTEPRLPSHSDLKLLETEPMPQMHVEIKSYSGHELADDTEQIPQVADLIVPTASPLPLCEFEFDTVTVNSSGSVSNRRKGQARYFAENINGVPLEMVEIPSGVFLMGSTDSQADQVRKEYERAGWRPEDATVWSGWETPQHTVTVKTFYMGKFEITQDQWRAATHLPKVNRDLITDPSQFKGDSLPVEQVSWEDAVEFCERLARATGRRYRLPSEAEWEYACRAGSTNQFAFGDTITPELVNYNGNYPYGAASKGTYREQTTPVGYFGIANAFGLYDMHGNVWEWCEDNWHDDYISAPADGNIWGSGDTSYRILRGGSWFVIGNICRAAHRNRSTPDFRLSRIGFRVVLTMQAR